MCKEQNVIDEAERKSAHCKDLPTGKGYDFFCDKEFDFDKEGVCKKKCDFKKNECITKNAECFLNENYEAKCRCPPLLSMKDGSCSEIAKASYVGEMSFLKSRYVADDEEIRLHKRSTDHFNQNIKLMKDLKESANFVYKDKFKNVRIIQCDEEGDILRCSLELQFNDEPDNVNALISPINCYTVEENYCYVKHLIVKKEKSNIFEPTNPCILKDTFCDESTICEGNTTTKTFMCMCAKGFRATGSFNPVSNEGNLVEKCADINECKTNIHDCKENTTCINDYGTYKCECNDGFRRKGKNLDPKTHGCEAVCDPNPCKNDGECLQKRNHEFHCKCKPRYTGQTCNQTVSVKPVEVDHKKAAIVGGILGTLLVLFLIAVIFLYRKLRRTESGVLAEASRMRSKQRKEEQDLEMDPGNRHARLQRGSGEYRRETFIPRVQTSRGRGEDQDRRDRRSDRRPETDITREDERQRSKMQFRNRAYDEEE